MHKYSVCLDKLFSNQNTVVLNNLVFKVEDNHWYFTTKLL